MKVCSVKAALAVAAAAANRGFTATQQQCDDVRALVRTLESTEPAAANKPARSPLLVGDWRLDFTDAVDMLSLSVAPGAVCEIGEVRQNIRADATASASTEEATAARFTVANEVDLQPRGSAVLRALQLETLGCYSILAECEVLSDSRISLTFAGGTLQPLQRFLGTSLPLPPLSGRLPPPLVSLIEEATRERVYLETTFLDESLRVARGPGRELYVLSRIGSL